jgi:hypothetical protein
MVVKDTVIPGNTGRYGSSSSPTAASSSSSAFSSSAPGSLRSPLLCSSSAPASQHSTARHPKPSQRTSTIAAPDRRVSPRKRTQPQRFGAPVASNPPSRGETQWPAPQRPSTAQPAAIQPQKASTQPHRSTGVSTRATTRRLQRQVEEQVEDPGWQLRPRKSQRL